jgi:hypothetical protein
VSAEARVMMAVYAPGGHYRSMWVHGRNCLLEAMLVATRAKVGTHIHLVGQGTGVWEHVVTGREWY